MWGNTKGLTKAVRIGLIVAAFTTVGLGVAAMPASADDASPTECSGTIGAETLSSVVVPQDAICVLGGHHRQR